MAELFLRETEGGDVAAFPYTIDQFRRDHPGVALRRNPSDEALAAFRVRRVALSAARPTVSAYERATLGVPVKDAETGAWSVDWIVQAMTAPEVENVRAGREVYIGEIIKRLRAADKIGDPALEAWVAGTPPRQVKTTILATGVSAARKRAALVDLTGASGPLARQSDAVAAIGATYAISDQQLDAFFGIGV